MAIIKCRECGQDVSSQARTCPHCGIAMPSNRVEPRRVASVVIIIIAVFIFILVKHTNESRRTHAYQAPTPASTPAPTRTPFNINAAVSYRNLEFKITNQDDFSWHNVRVRINDVYEKNVGTIWAKTSITVPAPQFVKSDGERFDPFRYQPLSVAIRAENSAGFRDYINLTLQ